MNLSKYIGKTFPAGKSAKELGIDTSRKFVVVGDWGCNKIKKGDTLTLQRTDGNSKGAYFKRLRTGKTYFFPFYCLAYLEEEDEKIEYTVDPEKDVDTTDFLSGMNYIPRVGDKVALTAVIEEVIERDNVYSVRFPGHTLCWLAIQHVREEITLVSRAPRTLTKAEAKKMLSEKLGEEITIE